MRETGLDAAWEALREDFVTSEETTNGHAARVVARHRPLIETEARAELAAAANELLIVLDDAYPDTEVHLSPQQAIRALRSVLVRQGVQA